MFRNATVFLLFAAVTCLGSVTAGCTRNQYTPKIQEGLTVFKDGDKYGYAGKLGSTNAKLEARYDFAWPFSEGLAVVEVNKKQGYIDMNGEYRIPVQFDRAYNFSDGMARVRLGNKYGFINKDGKNQTGFEYDDATDFKNGVARVRSGGRIGLIDKGGHFVPVETNETFLYKPLNY